MEPCVPSPNDKHRASSFWPQQNPIDWAPEKTKTVVPFKYLLILPSFSKQMPSSCCLFIFNSVWLFVLTLLVLCRSRKAWCRLHPLSHSHQEGTGGRAAASLLRGCSGRWHVHTHTKGLFYFLTKTDFIDLFITPSFYSGWAETPSLDSLLYRKPVTAGKLWFLVPIQWDPKDSLNEFTLCISPTWDPSPNIKLNALNSASARYWWFALFL